MSDVRVQIKFRNALLQQLLDESPLPVYKIAEEAGVSYVWLMSIKALTRNPWESRTKDETYTGSSVRLAEYFKIPVDVLFPEDIYRIKWPSKIEKCFPADRIACLVESDNQRLRALLPHEFAEGEEMKITMNNVLKSLTSRERRVIEMRFGLDNEDSSHTLEEIGQELEVTRERIRQIENRALRKMRNNPRLKEAVG